jgi:hypothetical protein
MRLKFENQRGTQQNKKRLIFVGIFFNPRLDQTTS